MMCVTLSRVQLGWVPTRSQPTEPTDSYNPGRAGDTAPGNQPSVTGLGTMDKYLSTDPSCIFSGAYLNYLGNHLQNYFLRVHFWHSVFYIQPLMKVAYRGQHLAGHRTHPVCTLYCSPLKQESFLFISHIYLFQLKSSHQTNCDTDFFFFFKHNMQICTLIQELWQ